MTLMAHFNDSVIVPQSSAFQVRASPRQDPLLTKFVTKVSLRRPSTQQLAMPSRKVNLANKATLLTERSFNA